MHRFLCFVLLLLPTSAVLAQTPQPRDLVINEVMYDPPAPQPNTNEWIEVFNRSGQPIDLGAVTFSDDTGTPVTVAPPGTLIQPGAFAVLVRNAAAFEESYPGVPYVVVGGFPALNNGGDVPTLRLSGTEVVIDAVPYLPGWGGTDASLERLDPDGPSASAANWATTTDPSGGTPGAQNSVFAPDNEPPALLGTLVRAATEVEVRFSEPLDPATASDPARYGIDGGIGQPASVAVAPDGDDTRVLLTLAVPLQPNTPYTLTVTGVADLAGNMLQSAQAEVFFGQGAVPQPRDLVVNEILYDEPSSGSPGEFVELFNRSNAVFDLSEFTLSDAAGTVPVTDAPAFVAPGEYVVLVESAAAFEAVFPGVPFVAPPSWRALNDSGDAIVLAHASGVTVDSLFYDDAWGGRDRSLERKDPDGPSGFAVNWTTTSALLGTPGAQNSQYQPDTEGPRVQAVEVAGGGAVLRVVFDEPLDPATVSAGAFAVTPEAGGPAATVSAAAYLGDGPPTVRLSLAEPLAAGAYRLIPSQVTDLLGNVTPGEPFAFEYAPDVAPPALTLAFAVDPVTVEVVFSEPVTAETAGDPASYTIDGGVGQPESVAFPLAGDSTRAALTLATPLQERTLYALTVSGVEDREGNRLESATAPLFLGAGDAPAPGDLVVNEVMFDPVGGSAGEYVELFNRTDRLFLSELVLTDDPAGGGDPISAVPVVVPPNGYAVVVVDCAAFAVRFPEAPTPIVQAPGFPSLNNSGDTVALLYAGAVIDAVTYDPRWHRVELEDATGVALERVDPAGQSSSASNWSSSRDPRGGTPGAPNSVFVTPGPPPDEAGLTVDSPFDPDGGQSTAIRFTLETDAALIRVRIFDGAGRLVRRLEEGDFVGRTGAVLWDGRGADGRPLRIGPYVVLLEAVNVEGGTTEAHRGVVVLARRF